MSNASAAPKQKRALEELFDQAQLLLNEVVRNALHHCHHNPTVDDVKRFKQRLEVLLLEDDKKLLAELREPDRLKPWLQQIANHEVSRVLRQEGRNVSINAVLQETFIQPPPQEELLWQKEQMQLVEEALPELPPRARKLIELWRQGLEAEGIARKLGIKKMATFQVRKSEALKKLRELVKERQKKLRRGGKILG